MDLATLSRCSLRQLEELYAQSDEVSLPQGRYRGRPLGRLDQPGARRPGYVLSAGFQRVPFGIDFDTCCWFFWSSRLQAGRFEPRVAPSQWRDTTTVGLHYQPSRLPHFVKRVLYDEVKPLTDDLALGMGGLVGPRGRGDHFFFSLARLS